MSDRQENHELACGNAFIKWFNEASGTNFSYFGRAGDAPDLVYKDGSVEIKIEHTGAYYESTHAAFINRNNDETEIGNEPWLGESLNFDRDLTKEIEHRITQKSLKDYGGNCVLLIEIPPSVTAAEDLERLVSSLNIQEKMQNFIGVYLAGRFTMTATFSGGYKVIPVKEIANKSLKNDAEKRAF